MSSLTTVTGGFRRRAAMNEALRDNQLDLIGLGRPMCVDTDLPRRLLSGEWAQAVSYEQTITPPKAGLAWFCLQLLRLGEGLTPQRELDGVRAMTQYANREAAAAAALQGR